MHEHIINKRRIQHVVFRVHDAPFGIGVIYYILNVQNMDGYCTVINRNDTHLIAFIKVFSYSMAILVTVW